MRFVRRGERRPGWRGKQSGGCYEWTRRRACGGLGMLEPQLVNAKRRDGSGGGEIRESLNEG